MTPLVAAAPASGGQMSIIILLLPVLVLLWLMFTQRRRQKAVKEAQQTLTVGDEVMAAAGLYGTVSALEDDVVHLEIAPGVVVRVNRRAIVPPTAADGAGPGATHARDDRPQDGPTTGETA